MAFEDLGIDENELLVLLLWLRREIQDEETKRQGHLVGGQPHPPGGVHEVKHLLDGRPKVLVDPGHGSRLITQCGVGVVDDLEHERSSGQTVW